MLAAGLHVTGGESLGSARYLWDPRASAAELLDLGVAGGAADGAFGLAPNDPLRNVDVLEFDGDDYVEWASGEITSGGGANHTFAFVIAGTVQGDFEPIFDHGSGRIQLLWADAAGFLAYFESGGVGYRSWSQDPILTGALQTLVFTFDDPPAAAAILYRNGAQLGSAIGYTGTALAAGSIARLGRAFDAADYLPAGCKIGVSAYWPAVLSASEVAALHRELKAIYPSLP